MTMRQFGSAAKAAEAKSERDPNNFVEYKIVDRPVKFYHPGSAGLVHLSMAQAAVQGPGDDMARGIAAVPPFIMFVTSLVDDADAAHIRRLLSTEGSGFDIMDLQELADALMDDWSNATPTKPASDSSDTRAGTGKRSTANSRRAASTRSTSPSTDS